MPLVPNRNMREGAVTVSYTHLLLITPLHVDELVQKTGLTASQLKSKLTVMEVKGYIKQLPGQNYVIGNIIL